AVQHIAAHFDEPCTLEHLAALAGLSRFHFVRVFSAAIGQSPTQYLINTRLRAAAERLREEQTPIVQVAFDVGFNDLSHFYACFRDAFGRTPRQWRMA
ncbi:MAG: helix-turn-helix transcriptional regulator, partial [Vitreimonas sp.]